MRKQRTPDPRLAYFVTKIFLEARQVAALDKKRVTVEDIANRVLSSSEFKVKAFKREDVYDQLADALALNILHLIPPVSEALRDGLCHKFPDLHPQHVHVVDTPTRMHGSMVAEHAAGLVMRKMSEFSRSPKSVGIGLGPGAAALDFATFFAQYLKGASDLPRVSLYAISGGAPASQPHYAPASFFALFNERTVDERVAIFAEPMIQAKHFAELKTRQGIKEAFKAKEEGKINIVVTSMGDFDDEHDLYRQYLLDSGKSMSIIRKAGWKGNIQYRPYDSAAPAVEKGSEFRPVTLFEISDLVKMAQEKNREVILVARQCRRCGASRGAALLPILTSPSLRAFSELVVDSATAADLLGMKT